MITNYHMEKQAYDCGDCSQSVESPVNSSAIVVIIWKIKFSFCQQSPTITATANDHSDCQRLQSVGKNKAWSPYSRNDLSTWFQPCSKEGFKAVNISIANISCVI